ncbi:hypothetical protein JM93_00969 [Roseibium hamelinense]|uniref:Uncharacterized protein n=1 Tax=Roseibium hamelinense TaxID=150831 RepID=A0A562TIH2_9HYPH|nr:hypothetical protein [Roseibium hamelinense]MTI42766.1 hypothetical protein [Roseibium hamelinense]TWI93412.1 hypothetical protein JM93_00969 [Roseibium hamelinense]
MKHNLKTIADRQSPAWTTKFKQPDLKSMQANTVAFRKVDGQSNLRLITRSGFETKHICTSAIASM